MRTLGRALFTMAVLAAFVPAAAADTHVVEIADVQLNTIYVRDLGAALSGIGEVSMRAEGVGGRGLYHCEAPAAGGWYDLDVEICLGHGCVELPMVYGESYDVTQTAVLTEGSWQICEGGASCPLYILVNPHGFVNYDPMRYCWLEQLDAPPISRLLISITADSVVATESSSWGAIKAMYRH